MALSDYYIHYWQEHIPEEVWVNKVWYETKEQILERNLLNLAKRQERIKRTARKNNVNEEVVSQFLDGTMLKGISEIDSADYADTERIEEFDPSQIVSILRKDMQNLDNIDLFVEHLNKYLQTFSDETQNMLDGYVQEVMDKISKNKILQQLELKEYSSTEKVIAALMGKFSNGAFKIPDNANERYNTAIGKVALIARAIPTSDLEKSVLVRHGDKKEGKEVNGIYLYQEVVKKCIAWLREADKTLKEVTMGAGMIETHLKMKEELKQLEQQIVFGHTGNDYYESRFQPDPILKEILEEVGQRQAYYKKKAKKDFSIDITDEGGKAIISFGANAKNYEKAISANLKSYSLKIQDGTPLSTFLGREAGYTGEDLWVILQVAAGVSRNNDYTRADSLWNSLMQKIGYRSLLNALAGFEKTDDQSFYMVINGNFWTMADFIEHFLLSDSSVATSVIKNKDNKKGKGTIRSTYSDINKQNWQVDTEEDGILDDAQDRSTLVWKESMQVMYETKIRVEITMRDLSKLMSQVL